MKLLFLLLTLTSSLHADPPPEVTKSPRMAAIEEKYHMELVGILRAEKSDYWVFLELAPESLFKCYPVVVPHDALDRDIDVARVAAEKVASFYDSGLKGHVKPETAPEPLPTPSPSPAGNAFTIPTHHRMEVAG